MFESERHIHRKLELKPVEVDKKHVSLQQALDNIGGSSEREDG